MSRTTALKAVLYGCSKSKMYLENATFAIFGLNGTIKERICMNEAVDIVFELLQDEISIEYASGHNCKESHEKYMFCPYCGRKLK